MIDTEKPLWMRKTCWIGVALIVSGLVKALFPGDEFEFSIGALLSEQVLLGLAIITGRQGLAKLGKSL